LLAQTRPAAGSLRRDRLGITIVGSGFPHSEIFGSKLVRSSPKHIAAYHVLHRLSVPRHPPNALKTLDRSHYRCSPGAEAPDGAAIRKTILLREFIRKWRDVRPRDPMTAPASRHRPDELPLHHVKQQAKAQRVEHCVFAKLASSDDYAIRARPDGGARRDRTDDLMLAKHALSQLSYGPDRIHQALQAGYGGPGKT
jgi:hypothetical protein